MSKKKFENEIIYLNSRQKNEVPHIKIQRQFVKNDSKWVDVKEQVKICI